MSSDTVLCDICDDQHAIVYCVECDKNGLGNLCVDDDATIHSQNKNKLHIRTPINSINNNNSNSGVTSVKLNNNTLNRISSEAVEAGSLRNRHVTTHNNNIFDLGNGSYELNNNNHIDRINSDTNSIKQQSGTGTNYNKYATLPSNSVLASMKQSVTIPTTTTTAATPIISNTTNRYSTLQLSTVHSRDHDDTTQCEVCESDIATYICDSCINDINIKTKSYCTDCNQLFHNAKQMTWHARKLITDHTVIQPYTQSSHSSATSTLTSPIKSIISSNHSSNNTTLTQSIKPGNTTLVSPTAMSSTTSSPHTVLRTLTNNSALHTQHNSPATVSLNEQTNQNTVSRSPLKRAVTFTAVVAEAEASTSVNGSNINTFPTHQRVDSTSSTTQQSVRTQSTVPSSAELFLSKLSTPQPANNTITHITPPSIHTAHTQPVLDTGVVSPSSPSHWTAARHITSMLSTVRALKNPAAPDTPSITINPPMTQHIQPALINVSHPPPHPIIQHTTPKSSIKSPSVSHLPSRSSSPTHHLIAPEHMLLNAPLTPRRRASLVKQQQQPINSVDTYAALQQLEDKLRGDMLLAEQRYNEERIHHQHDKQLLEKQLDELKQQTELLQQQSKHVESVQQQLLHDTQHVQYNDTVRQFKLKELKLLAQSIGLTIDDIDLNSPDLDIDATQHKLQCKLIDLQHQRDTQLSEYSKKQNELEQQLQAQHELIKKYSAQQIELQEHIHRQNIESTTQHNITQPIQPHHNNNSTFTQSMPLSPNHTQSNCNSVTQPIHQHVIQSQPPVFNQPQVMHSQFQPVQHQQHYMQPHQLTSPPLQLQYIPVPPPPQQLLLQQPQQFRHPQPVLIPSPEHQQYVASQPVQHVLVQSPTHRHRHQLHHIAPSSDESDVSDSSRHDDSDTNTQLTRQSSTQSFDSTASSLLPVSRTQWKAVANNTQRYHQHLLARQPTHSIKSNNTKQTIKYNNISNNNKLITDGVYNHSINKYNKENTKLYAEFNRVTSLFDSTSAITNALNQAAPTTRHNKTSVGQHVKHNKHRSRSTSTSRHNKLSNSYNALPTSTVYVQSPSVMHMPPVPPPQYIMQQPVYIPMQPSVQQPHYQSHSHIHHPQQHQYNPSSPPQHQPSHHQPGIAQQNITRMHVPVPIPTQQRASIIHQPSPAPSGNTISQPVYTNTHSVVSSRQHSQPPSRRSSIVSRTARVEHAVEQYLQPPIQSQYTNQAIQQQPLYYPNSIPPYTRANSIMSNPTAPPISVDEYTNALDHIQAEAKLLFT